jgi:hypothetical protein
MGRGWGSADIDPADANADFADPESADADPKSADADPESADANAGRRHRIAQRASEPAHTQQNLDDDRSSLGCGRR